MRQKAYARVCGGRDAARLPSTRPSPPDGIAVCQGDGVINATAKEKASRKQVGST